MNQLRLSTSLASKAARRRWRTVLGLAAMTMALANVTDASAESKAGPKDQKGQHESGRGAPGDKGKGGGLRDMFGGGKADGKPDGKPDAERNRHDHERGAAGAAGLDRHQRGQPRKARLAELMQKETAGKLTAEEKAELAKAQEIQARHDALVKDANQKGESRKNRSRDAKRQTLKEYPKLGQDAAGLAEYRKHAERLAKLERVKELATADQHTDVIQKVDALIVQEKQRHQTWLTKHPSPAQGANQ